MVQLFGSFLNHLKFFHLFYLERESINGCTKYSSKFFYQKLIFVLSLTFKYYKLFILFHIQDIVKCQNVLSLIQCVLCFFYATFFCLKKRKNILLDQSLKTIVQFGFNYVPVHYSDFSFLSGSQKSCCKNITEILLDHNLIAVLFYPVIK